MLEQLSTMLDLIAWREDVIDGTDKGRRLKPDHWHNTRVYMEAYGNPGDAERVIDLFKELGAPDEILALRIVLKYDRLVP